jgi:hypothetical protein
MRIVLFSSSVTVFESRRARRIIRLVIVTNLELSSSNVFDKAIEGTLREAFDIWKVELFRRSCTNLKVMHHKRRGGAILFGCHGLRCRYSWRSVSLLAQKANSGSSFKRSRSDCVSHLMRYRSISITVEYSWISNKANRFYDSTWIDLFWFDLSRFHLILFVFIRF